MKKVKFYKKQKRKRKIKISKKVLIKIIINLTIFIIIAIIIIFFIFKLRENEFKEPEIIEITETIFPKEIMYKGAKILKTQLLADYFSRISINEQNNDDERIILNKMLNLSEYSKDPSIKNKYKNQFLNYFSEKKTK